MTHRDTQKGSRQQGFFTVGAGLVLLAIYSAIGAGVLVAHDPSPTDGQQPASSSPSQLPTPETVI